MGDSQVGEKHIKDNKKAIRSSQKRKKKVKGERSKGHRSQLKRNPSEQSQNNISNKINNDGNE